jgi:uncharacterized protein
MNDLVMEKSLQWADSWAKDGLRVTWYGGEPLIWADGIERWDREFRRTYGKNRPYYSSITTNGTLLTEEIMGWMDELGIGIMISMDGPPWVQNRQRPFAAGVNKPTWDAIDPFAKLKWRKNLTIAWQIDPDTEVTPNDLDWMIGNGFRNINFNINWNKEWNLQQQEWLRVFMREVGKRVDLHLPTPSGEFRSNFAEKLNRSVSRGCRISVPCGTGDNYMLAVTPEGWLYPSQEMAFTAVAPERARGTAEHYRVGDVFKDPVIDSEAVARVSGIRVEDMTPSIEFRCDDCHAEKQCVGSCHCRLVGINGIDPAWRHHTLKGYCQSIRAAIGGMIEGAVISGRVELGGK